MTQIAIPNADPVATLTFEDVVTVDISSFTGVGDYISLSLPEYQAAKLVQSKCFIDFTSNPHGDFGAGPTDNIAFSQASPALPTTGTADVEMRLPISLLTKVDKSIISGVRIRLFSSETAVFRCLAIRACAEGWKYAPIDLDTLWHRAMRAPTPDGSLGTKTNYFTNPSGEVALKVPAGSNWSGTREKGTIGIPAYKGEYRDKYEMGIASTRINVGTFTFPAAGTYIMSCYVWLNSEWNGGKVKIAFGSDFTKESETILLEADTAKKGQWQRVATRVQVGSADLIGTYELVYISAPSTGAKSVIYTDAMMVEAGNEPTTYFDGANGGAWTGAANSSTSVANAYAFPEAATEPYAWPIIMRSNPVQGVSDPMPVNLNLGVAFTAGSFTKATGVSESTFNQIAVYLRDVPTDDQTQIELDGNGIGTGGFNQAQLDAINHQSDFGRAMYKARLQAELDKDWQEQIDTATQFQIERIPDESEHSWIEVKFKWCGTQANNTLTIKEADGNGYTFSNIPIVASAGGNLEVGRYIMLIYLLDNRIRVKIYKTDQVGNILENELVFDTGNILDDNLFKRYRGRVGWWAQFPDGDAFMTGFRTRGVNFGELVSKEFQSITPVKGTSLFAGSTADKELVRYLATTDPVNTTALLDPSVSDSGRAYRVVTTPLRPLQGLATNMFTIDDPMNLDISFNINFPSSEIPGGGLSAYLIGAYFQIIPLQLPAFAKDTWAHVKIPPPTALYQTGNYQLVLMQALPVVSTTWFVDNVSVKTKAVKWWARSHVPDAWQEETDGWQPVGFTLNSLNGGVVFSEKGNGLQIKAQALHQEAEIHGFKAVPQYATLGRTVWPEGASTGAFPSSVSIAKAQVEGRKWKFTGSATDTDGYPTFLWSLGDGTYDAGKVVTHTYKLPGTYKIILYATDNFGNTTTATGSVTIT